MPIGFTIPFAKTTGSLGLLETTNNEVSAVKQNLMSLLLTNWGERPMHYNFGCNFKEFVFEQRTPELKDRIEDRVRTQVFMWMPYVTVEDLQIYFSEETGQVPENGLGVHVKFRLVGRPDLSNVLDIVVPGS